MWWFIVSFALSLAVSFLMVPKVPGVKPAGLSEFSVPTAEVGREISVLFGTREISGPNVVWYGHLRSVAIKAKGGKKG